MNAVFFPPGISDHCAMVVIVNQDPSRTKAPFKIFNYWTDHEKYAETVEEGWKTEVWGTPMFVLCKKLRARKGIEGV